MLFTVTELSTNPQTLHRDFWLKPWTKPRSKRLPKFINTIRTSAWNNSMSLIRICDARRERCIKHYRRCRRRSRTVFHLRLISASTGKRRFLSANVDNYGFTEVRLHALWRWLLGSKIDDQQHGSTASTPVITWKPVIIFALPNTSRESRSKEYVWNDTQILILAFDGESRILDCRQLHLFP